MKPKVSIILLNCNNEHFTIDCLQSLTHVTYPNIEPIVVDNGSKPESVEKLKAAFPRTILIENGKNLGFTGGNNVGVKYALEHGGDYIMLLNNDTIVAPDMFDILVEVMENDKTIGVTGPMIYFYDAPDMIWSVGGRINWKNGQTQMLGLYEEDKGQFGLVPKQTDFVTGCALMVRRDVWEKAGLLDDNFFIYYEETEWCVRASRTGCKIMYVPSAMMWHKIPLEARANSIGYYYYMTRNRLLFLHKSRAGLRSWLGITTELARTWLSWTLRPKWKDRRHLRGVMVRAIRDYSTGKFGQVTV
ncbi:MAG: glycosyltransferase family 2 protein [Anaerolineae bacterium]|nr:glycosyltransferase family 2 protein [Anaerolineae bacterium]